MTSEQKENQSWREESEISANSDELRFGLESNLECDDENSNPENEYVASAKLPKIHYCPLGLNNILQEQHS